MSSDREVVETLFNQQANDPIGIKDEICSGCASIPYHTVFCGKQHGVIVAWRATKS